VRIRALFGLYEGNPDEPTFAGAVGEVTYELSDDEEWDRLLARMKENAPHGTTDWREVWIEFDEPELGPPTLDAITEAPKEQHAA
jgi:hypothetical protein